MKGPLRAPDSVIRWHQPRIGTRNRTLRRVSAALVPTRQRAVPPMTTHDRSVYVSAYRIMGAVWRSRCVAQIGRQRL